MSLDMVSSAAALQVDPVYRFKVPPSEPLAGIIDLVFVFGGFAAPGIHPPGSSIPREEPRDVGHLVARVRKMKTLPGHQLMVFDYNPAIEYDSFPFSTALSALYDNFHPLGHLIIYGFSAGGFIALEFTRRIWNSPRDPLRPASGLLSLPLPALPDQVPSGLIGFVRVDYLITIDGAVGRGRTLLINRRVPPCVRRNLQYYQTNPNLAGSRGAPNQKMNPHATYIRSRDLTRRLEATGKEPHTNIDNYTHETAIKKIQHALLTQTYTIELPLEHIRASPPQTTHVVSRGENLWKLAQRYYGNGRLWQKIYHANRGKIEGNPNLIYPGTELLIPSR